MCSCAHVSRIPHDSGRGNEYLLGWSACGDRHVVMRAFARTKESEMSTFPHPLNGGMRDPCAHGIPHQGVRHAHMTECAHGHMNL